MMTGSRTAAALLLALATQCGGLAGVAWAEPPADADVKQAAADFAEAVKAGGKRDETARKVLEKIDVNELTASQIQTLIASRVADGDKGLRAKIAERAKALAAKPGLEGAQASMQFVDLFAPPDVEMTEEIYNAYESERAKHIVAALSHPAFPLTLKETWGGEMFSKARYTDLKAFAGTGIIEGLPSQIDPTLPAMTLARLRYAVDIGLDPDAKVKAEDTEALRTSIVKAIETKLTDSDIKANEKASLERTKKFLGGAYARNQLVNHAAPGLDFTWSSTTAGATGTEGSPLTSLADLKGKVVVIDFWATWCGPCIGSFPKVRQLAAHYEGYPVVVLGVTSLQGYHIDYKSGERPTKIDAKDDAAKETGLMPTFMTQMEMTWPVVFAKQEVFNPDYGVQGIPHVVILDPSGVVRHRGLHPGTDLEDKVAKIDAILKEFKLATPAPEIAPAKEEKKVEQVTPAKPAGK